MIFIVCVSLRETVQKMQAAQEVTFDAKTGEEEQVITNLQKNGLHRWQILRAIKEIHTYDEHQCRCPS